MKPRLLITLLAATALARAAAAQAPTATVIRGKAPVAKNLLTVHFPRPKRFTLAGGAKILVIEDHRLPLVHLSIITRSGSAFEEKRGVADLTASMLREGTKTRSAEELDRQLDEIGATLTADAGILEGTLSISGLSSDTDRLVDLLTDVLLNPSFPEERLRQVKFRTVAGLVQQRTNPTFLASQLAGRLEYGHSPYAGTAPTPEQVQAITQADLVTFHQHRYQPAGALIGVAGDVNPNRIADRLKSALAAWHASSTANPEGPPAQVQPAPPARIHLIDRPASVQTYLRFFAPGVRRNDPDYIPLVVANEVLGGGFTSRLNMQLREKEGFTYGASSGIIAPEWPGSWAAATSVRTPVTEPAVRDTYAEFQRLRADLVSAGELDRDKRTLVGGFARDLENPQTLLSRALDLERYGLPADYWDIYPAKIQAVTPEEVQRVARKYLAEDRVQLVAVGERSQIAAGLEHFGTVDVIKAPGAGGAAAPRLRIADCGLRIGEPAPTPQSAIRNPQSGMGE